MRFGTRSSFLVQSVAIVALLSSGAGCDSDSGSSDQDAIQSDVPTAALAITGSYTDGFGAQHEIASDTWAVTGDMGAGPVTSTFLLTRYDNTSHWVVGQNDATNQFNAGQWSRFDWATVGAILYFCQTRYNAADEAEALAATPADPTDPVAGGCSGFPWTVLTPVVK
jgi:hypothetical protein